MYAGILQKLGMRLEWDDSKRVLFIQQIPETGGVVLSDGSKYEGELLSDVPSGKGMLFDKLGRLIYEGEFKAGKFHGQGKLYSETGELEYSGAFDQGNKIEAM
ncbi:MORN repeat protein [compost metagenome]